MIGVAISECKGAKVKNFSRLIQSTQEDRFHRIDYEYIRYDRNLPDFFVQNGMKKRERGDTNKYYEFVEQKSKKYNIPILIRELPVIRQICIGQTDKHTMWRDRWIRTSWNSFYMDEGLHPYDPTYARWDDIKKEYNIIVNEWRERGSHILFCLQLDGDSALNRIIYDGGSYKEYCYNKILEIRKHTDRPIKIRNHPLDKGVGKYLKNKFINDTTILFSQGTTLEEDLNNCYCMVTYNSTSCVEAAINGTYVIVLDPSAVANPVSNRIRNIEYLKDFDREEWFNRISFMQWQGKEMTSGYVWDLLKKAAKFS